MNKRLTDDEAGRLDKLRDLEPQVCDVTTASRALLSLFEHHIYPLQNERAELDGEQIEVLAFMVGDILHRAEKLREGYYAAGWPQKGGAS